MLIIKLELWFFIVVCVICFWLGMLFDMSLRVKSPRQVIHDILHDHQPIKDDFVRMTQV